MVTSWTALLASTPNDGSENISLPSSLNGQSVKIRVSAIGNVFYAVKSVAVSAFATCNGNAPTSIVASNLTVSSADTSWAPIAGATYIVRYKKVSETTWITINTSSINISLSNLLDGTAYEFQVAAVCSGNTKSFFCFCKFYNNCYNSLLCCRISKCYKRLYC